MNFWKKVEFGAGLMVAGVAAYWSIPESKIESDTSGEARAVAFSNDLVTEVSYFKPDSAESEEHFSFTTEAIDDQQQQQVASVQAPSGGAPAGGTPVACSVQQVGGQQNAGCNPPPVLSVAGTGGGNPTSACSAFGTIPNGPTAPTCSVTNNAGSPAAPAGGHSACSVGVPAAGAGVSPCSTVPARNPAPSLMSCSVTHQPGLPAVHCSTTVNKSNGGHCSAHVQMPANPIGGNRECSVRNGANAANPAQSTCSVAQGTDTVTCSTSGGASAGAPGNPSCSAGRETNTPNNGRCSVVNVAHQATCSTNKGQHQNCSTGRVGDSQSQRCSAFASNTANPQFCSVKEQPPAGGTYNNKCSALNNNSGQATASHCSVHNHNANTKQVCSVIKGQTTGGRCTVINDTGFGNQNSKCSTFNPAEVQGNGSRCSVIDMGPPIVITRPGKICGTGVGHFDDTDGDGWPDIRDNYPYDPSRH